MKRHLFICVLFFFAAGRASDAAEMTEWRSDLPCGRKLPPIQETKIPGCKDSYSLVLPDGLEFSACLVSEEKGNVRMRVQRAGTLLSEWTTQIMPPAGPSSETIRLEAIDLDRDGKEELLISVMEAMSVGMARSYWSVWAFDGSKLSEPVTAEDYGVLSFPVCSKDGKNGYLLLSHWLPGWEPKRGDGLYLSACWFTLGGNAGSFSPAYQRPSVYRRYLFSFEKLRGEALGRDRPEPWYQSPDTRVVVGPKPCR